MVHTGVDRRSIAAAIAGGFLSGALFGRAGAAPGAAIGRGVASRLAHPLDQDYVPPSSLAAVADIYRRMTVPIGVGGAGPFPFVVDTGANQSVISAELVARLGLPVGPVELLNGVAGVQNEPTTITNLRIGAANELGVTLSILPAADIGGAGMLGLDRLGDKVVTLDFRRQVLRIAVSKHLPRDKAEVTVRARRRNGQLTLVDADIAGIPLIAFLDSGAQSTIGNRALRVLAASRSPTAHWVNIPIISATGQTIMAEMADLPHLRIGGLKLPDWPVAFADLHTFRMWGLIERPAILIGVDVLSRFESVSLDFGRDEVRFRPPTWSTASAATGPFVGA